MDIKTASSDLFAVICGDCNRIANGIIIIRNSYGQKAVYIGFDRSGNLCAIRKGHSYRISAGEAGGAVDLNSHQTVQRKNSQGTIAQNNILYQLALGTENSFHGTADFGVDLCGLFLPGGAVQVLANLLHGFLYRGNRSHDTDTVDPGDWLTFGNKIAILNQIFFYFHFGGNRNFYGSLSSQLSAAEDNA